MLFQKGEDMATNILLVNQKGGVGKTTFADEIAWGLERRGHKVGFGNLDPQGGANHEKNLLDDEDAVNVIDTPGFLRRHRRVCQECGYRNHPGAARHAGPEAHETHDQGHHRGQS